MVAARPDGVMEVLVDTLRWFTDPVNWSGNRGIPVRLLEHLALSVVPLVAAAAVAIPAGVLSGHYRRWHGFGAAVANGGRAMPTLALLVFGFVLAIWLGLGFRYWPTVFALFFLALHPLFTNAYTAVREIDPDLVENARGMGLLERQVLTGVELPLAAPVILTAVRIAAVQVIATAPLAALTAGGGFGRYIIDGFYQFRYEQMLGGIVLVALLAVLAERTLDVVERLVVPPGVGGKHIGEVAATGRAV